METQQLFEYDKEIRTLHPIFCGLDEAGRGPLAGDVYAAAVVFDDGVCIEVLNDSLKIVRLEVSTTARSLRRKSVSCSLTR